MNNIKISGDNNRSFYRPKEKSIYLGMDNKTYKQLSDKEIINHTTDLITHEFIHYLLHKKFNKTVSKLYDLIEGNFVQHKQLRNKVFRLEGLITHKQAIKEYGLKHFVRYYHLTLSDFNNAIEICNKRK